MKECCEVNFVYSDETKRELIKYRGNETSVRIPEGVTKIGSEAFDKCSSLSEVIIPEGVTGIGDRTFNCCTNLSLVIIPESVTEIGVALGVESTSGAEGMSEAIKRMSGVDEE